MPPTAQINGKHQGKNSLCAFFALSIIEFITRYTTSAVFTAERLGECVDKANEDASREGMTGENMPLHMEDVQKKLKGLKGVVVDEVNSYVEEEEMLNLLNGLVGFHVIITSGMCILVYHKSRDDPYVVFNSHAPYSYARAYPNAKEALWDVLDFTSWKAMGEYYKQVDILHVTSCKELPSIVFSDGQQQQQQQQQQLQDDKELAAALQAMYLKGELD